MGIRYNYSISGSQRLRGARICSFTGQDTLTSKMALFQPAIIIIMVIYGVVSGQEMCRPNSPEVIAVGIYARIKYSSS